MTRCRRCGGATSPGDLVCRYCGHRVNEEWRAGIRTRRKKRRRLMIFIPLIASVFLAILLFAAWPRDDGAGGDGSISAANSYISQIVAANDALYVNLDLPTYEKPDDMIVQAGQIARDAGRAIKGGASEVRGGTKWIVFQVTTPTVDSKGNRARANVFLMKIDVAQLKNADYKVTSGTNILDMVETLRPVRPNSDRAFAIYCKGKNAAMAARHFCLVADQARPDPMLMPNKG